MVSFLNISVLLFLCLAWIEVHLCCIEEERIGLLNLKQTFINYSSNGFEVPISSWGIEEETDCCKWERVECDPITKRVLQLHLHNTIYPPHNENLYLNLSLFHPFQELQNLYLYRNYFKGFHGVLTLNKLQKLDLSYNRLTEIPSLDTLNSLKYLNLGLNGINNNSNFQELKKLKALETLNLGYSRISGQIPPSIINMTSLRALSLSNNELSNISWDEGFHGVLTLNKLQKLDLSFNTLTEIPSLGALHSLKYLDLSSNYIYRRSNFQELKKLKALEILNLGSNDISGQIPPSFINITSLRALSLRHNFLLNGSWDEGLCRLKNLEELDLSWNEFSGVIPSCLNNFTSLKFLDLSRNHLIRTIPSTLFLNFKSLEYVSLSSNHFQRSFSLMTSFGNNSKLEVFQLDNDNINQLKVYTENSNWTPPFQLKVLQISNCELHDLNFLVNQHDLRVVILSHNGMVGKFPNWLILNNTNLEVASLKDNLFTGPFSLHPNTRYLEMNWLDISANQIHGEIPNFIGSILPNLIFLDMSANKFQGSIPPSVGDMTELENLDLSHNNLSGEIPELLVMGCTSLQLLKLSNNNLQGSLLPIKSNLSNLQYLSLNNNYFSGVVLPGLINSNYLELLDISDNTISGEIPYWLGNFSHLRLLALSRNSFEGHLSDSFCRLQELSFLDLSHNRFDGVIPSCVSLTYLNYLHLQGNRFVGPLPHNLARSSSLVTLDLRDNKFSGKVPDWISSLPSLKFILLKENNFNGSVPFQICQLNISVLDMSFNNFSGMIPTCLCQISFGAENHSASEFLRSYYGDRGFGPRYSYSNDLKVYPSNDFDSGRNYVDEEIEFVSKRRSESYIGKPLGSMSGLDLSSNKLTGPIPNELGNLTYIHTLNLSHNQLSGLIPSTLSKLKQVQSLDLSYNKLCGQIPAELIELNFLSVFSVAYNNLSGRLLDMKAQLGTFDESSYEGNPLLCGPPLKKSCNSNNNGQSPSNVNSGEDDSDSFRNAFLLSFLGSFAAAFLSVISFLYISAYYRRRLFAFIEAKIGVCHCILLKLFVITRK